MIAEQQRAPIVIDTDVFVHLFNPQANTAHHINRLLGIDGIALTHQLYVDAKADGKSLILEEYWQHLPDVSTKADDESDEIYVLKLWLVYHEPEKIQLHDNNLRMAIDKVLPRSETRDRRFIQTAAMSQGNLISNDQGHIGNNRKEIKSVLKKHGYRQTEILNSLEAKQKYCP